MKMRPFRPFIMLAALAACSGVGFGSAPASPAAISSQHPGGMKMANGKSYDVTIDKLAQIGCAGMRQSYEAPKWHRLNQRQIRKNARRAHAAGARSAFL